MPGRARGLEADSPCTLLPREPRFATLLAATGVRAPAIAADLHTGAGIFQ